METGKQQGVGVCVRKQKSPLLTRCPHRNACTSEECVSPFFFVSPKAARWWLNGVSCEEHGPRRSQWSSFTSALGTATWVGALSVQLFCRKCPRPRKQVVSRTLLRGWLDTRSRSSHNRGEVKNEFCLRLEVKKNQKNS